MKPKYIYMNSNPSLKEKETFGDINKFLYFISHTKMMLQTHQKSWVGDLSFLQLEGMDLQRSSHSVLLCLP